LRLLAKVPLGRVHRVGAETVLVLGDTLVLFLFDDLSGESERRQECDDNNY
jgi:hypothetical protein